MKAAGVFTLQLDLGNELIIDNFAGGGGTSTGLERAFGRPVDIAINHDPEALAMHAINHPHTKHLCESVWDVDPIKVTNNQPVGLVWLSPDCKHFSKAKGGKPVEKKIRGLAWVTLRWAAKCKPRVIMLENVEEFKTWGPLLIAADGTAKPDPVKKGKTFDSFIRQLRAHGYTVDYKEMRASDHATPTIRKRFFLVARRDGLPICWPAATHGAPTSVGVLAGKLLPHRTAAECIDFSIPCPSIFERKRPLADATMRRIAKGIMRYVVDSAAPFIVGAGGPARAGEPRATTSPMNTLVTRNDGYVCVPSIVPVTHQGGDRSESINEPFRTITGAHRGEKALAIATLVDAAHGEVSPTGVKRWGKGHRDIEAPLPTVTASGGNSALVTAFLNEHANASNQRVMPADEPLRTISAQGQHHGEVRAFLLSYYGSDQDPRIGGPLATVTSRDRFGLVTIHGQDYQIVDIGLRMLAPAELYRAQGFPGDYIINEIPDPALLFVDGQQTTMDPLSLPRVPLTKSAQVRMCGNSVCPPLSEALIRANFTHEREVARAAGVTSPCYADLI
ncbi:MULTISPECIES: DNA cytosine methyltransferase [unclassified Janthinobacterium]|uniref:DNA cytosine methyltransferase n=1 Tax=unclassified Janthinobacterium TaxID=2610881 RepID=UPI00034D70C6|nr:MULTISPECIES: DNA cytosine methyltransferase [unclassified Janthinobacterium]MEC5161704.1 DNA (cytosine-5)-methyltransferase 1 [Janthinobacterium sp. CG_S6]